MPNYSVRDWMEVSNAPEENTQRADEIVRDISGSIDLGVYSLLNLVADLGPFIGPDDDLITVARALGILPPVFKIMQTEPLRQDVVALITYFCARLENVEEIQNYRAGIQEVADSLLVITTWERFPPADAATVTTAVFGLADGSTFKDLKVATRLTLFKIVDSLFRRFPEALIRDVGIKSRVSGLVSMAELEKNPSCLSVLFSLYAHLSRDWDLEDEELKKTWDSFIRYFPVSIGTAKQDPSVPTKEEIRSLLLQCILSNDYYAKEAIPRCIDMLDTSSDLSADTKTEVLATLASCVREYSIKTVSEWASKIWDSLKFEIWNGENEDFIQGSLKVLRTISVTLSGAPYEWTDAHNHLAHYVIAATKECSERLHDSRRQFLQPSGLILFSIASGSPYAFHLVVKTVIPAMQVIWQDLRLGSERNLVLGVFNNILQARLAQPDVVPLSQDATANMSPEMREYNSQSVLKMSRDFALFADGVNEVYFGAIADVKTKLVTDSEDNLDPTLPDLTFGVAAIKGLTLLFRIPGYLSAVEQGMIVNELNVFATSNHSDKDIDIAVLSALKEISAAEPKVFKEITLPNFVEKLPEKISLDPKKRKEELDGVLTRLESLVDISCTSPCLREFSDGPPPGAAGSFWHRNFDSMQQKLLEKLGSVLQHRGQLEYGTAILATICGGLEKFDLALDQARVNSIEPPPVGVATGPYTYLVMALFGRIIEQKSQTSGPSSATLRYTGLKASPVGESFNDTFIELVGRTAMLALRSKLTTPANNFLLKWNASFAGKTSAIWTLFSHGDNQDSLAVTQMNLEEGPADKCLANLLSMYLIAGTKPKEKDGLRIPVADVAASMIRNATSTTSSASKSAHMGMLWMLQLLVNKFGASKESLADGTKLLDIMKEVVETSTTMNGAHVARVYQVVAYFAAASVASFDETMGPLVTFMIEGLSHIIHGQKVAQSFRILLQPSPFLTKENFCTIRLLRKPRLFTMTIEPLIGLWQTATNSNIKENYLVAIAGILAFVDPAQVTDNNMAQKLLPVILEGTNVKNDDWAKAAFIKALATIIPLNPSLIEEHLDSTINRMTDRTHNTYDSPSDGSVRCRVLALEVLTLLVKHITPTLLLQRSIKFISELDVAKDDCAWEVRKRASQCRMAWWLLEDAQR